MPTAPERAAPAAALAARFRPPHWATAALSLAALTAILWLPFGLNVMGIREEWITRAFFADSTEWGGAELVTRPGVVPMIAAAHYLTPDSFVAYNLLHAAFFFGKGFLLYLLLRRLLPLGAVIALLAAALFIVYPADAGLMTLRATHIHGAVFFYLLALYLLLRYWDRPRPLTLALMWLALGISASAYEAGYALIAASPLLLLWLEKRLSRRVVRVALLWYLPPLLALANLAYQMSAQPLSIQNRVLEAGIAAGGRDGTSFLGEIVSGVALAFERHFLLGWQQAASLIGQNRLYAALGGAAAALLFIAALLLRPPSSRETARPIGWFGRWAGLLVAVGIIVVFLGIVVYLPTTRRYVDWRVYYYSSAGAALAVSAAAMFLSRLAGRRLAYTVFSLLLSALIGLSVVRALHQHAGFRDVGLDEQYLLGSIAAQAPALERPAHFFLLPTGPDQMSVGMLDSNAWTAQAALAFVYGRYDWVQGLHICGPTPCDFTPAGVNVGVEGEYIPYSDALVFAASSMGGLALLDAIPDTLAPAAYTAAYNPAALIDSTAAAPARVHTLFSQWPAPYVYPLVDRAAFAAEVAPRYSPDTPVIVSVTGQPCASASDCALYDWLGGKAISVPETERFYVTADTPADADTLAAFQAFLAGAPQVWHIQGYTGSSQEAQFVALLTAEYAPLWHENWDGRRFPAVTLYRRLPAAPTATLYRFGDRISLQSWRLQDSVQAQRCQPLTVESWWRADSAPARNYSLTMTLADAGGMGVARADGSPGALLPMLWTVGRLYPDERTVTVPCDAAPGEYMLLAGLYDYETQQRLPATRPDGAPADDLVYLTTVYVSE